MNDWKKILGFMEGAMDEISNESNNAEESTDIISPEESTEPEAYSTVEEKPVDENQILNELNNIFTPILVMQGLESNVSDQFKEACSEDNVLTEKNIIKFDDETRMAQLISVCALLIEKNKDSELFRTYQKAAQIKNSTKIEIQKKNYDEAKSLAQKYLVKVSTTNNSSVARQAANDLLPETQH